ncbi:MAG: rod-binding protein [Defluviitaleaceae bacterium]|nr:rod-binding protein [Defluviitaleaceae bacterium]
MNLSDISSIHSSLPDYESVRRSLAPVSGAGSGAMTPQELAEIQYAAEAFESYFLQIMLREMRNTIPDDNGFIPRSQAERIFTDMLDEQIAREATTAGGIGLATMIVQQMTRDRYMANMR